MAYTPAGRGLKPVFGRPTGMPAKLVAFVGAMLPRNSNNEARRYCPFSEVSHPRSRRPRNRETHTWENWRLYLYEVAPKLFR